MFAIYNLKSLNSLLKFSFVCDFTHIDLVYGVCENIQDAKLGFSTVIGQISH